MEVAIPRDRDGSFEPQIVGKRQRRLSEIDGLVISLSAKGLTHGEIAAQNRPLDPGRILAVDANRMGVFLAV